MINPARSINHITGNDGELSFNSVVGIGTENKSSFVFKKKSPAI